MARICEEHRLGGMKCDDDECVGCALDALIKERDRYGAALEVIRELMSPGNRHAFVSRGPMAFASVYNVVEDALAGKDSVR